jgi:hypothetical protein
MISLLLFGGVCAVWAASEDHPPVYERSSRPHEGAWRGETLAGHQGVLFYLSHDVTLTARQARLLDPKLKNGVSTPWESYWNSRHAYPKNFPGRSFLQLPEASRPWERLGVYVRYDRAGTLGTGIPGRVLTVGVPCWLLAVATLALPAVVVRRQFKAWRARRRARAMLCPTCGYDLRATPERCPECGATAAVHG